MSKSGSSLKSNFEILGSKVNSIRSSLLAGDDCWTPACFDWRGWFRAGIPFLQGTRLKISALNSPSWISIGGSPYPKPYPSRTSCHSGSNAKGRRPLGARGKEITSPVTSRDPSVTHPGKDQDVSWIVKKTGIAKNTGIAKKTGIVKKTGIAKKIGIAKKTEIAKKTGIAKKTAIAKKTGIVKKTGIAKKTGIVKKTGIAKKTGIVKKTGIAKKTGIVKKTGIAKKTGIVKKTVRYPLALYILRVLGQ
ncbi:hypothetical protein J6590_055207 [Homalodisca vitripennis]|nr:hypothetical protein J6590_055207 [Homalodisca vitripennis]